MANKIVGGFVSIIAALFLSLATNPAAFAAPPGPSDVNVINPATRPIPTKDAENPARQPFSAQVIVDPDRTPIIATVPQGKRLVIETITVASRMNIIGAGLVPRIHVRTNDNGNSYTMAVTSLG